MKKNNNMQAQWENSYLYGVNAAYLEGLYENFIEDSDSVSKEWKNCFEALPQTDGAKDVLHSHVRAYFRELAKKPATRASVSVDAAQSANQYKVSQLINAYRSYGHHHAKLDPLDMAERHNIPALHLSYYGLGDQHLSQQFSAGDFNQLQNASLQEIVRELEKTYCHSVGFEYMHITDTKERDWIRKRIETKHAWHVVDTAKKRILHDLVCADGMENYLAKKYVGQKRFSLEGGDALIPMLNEIIRRGGEKGIKDCVIGMPHRGRLNVLINVVGKPFEVLLEGFEGKNIIETSSGDVKYHMGYSADIQTPGGSVHVSLAFNPSHLEAVSPVVEGSVRARQRRRSDQHHDEVLAVILHGDAAFAGQGVVMETFNMSQARGYFTGGTVHIVVNNQIGFTTSNPLDARSTLYCTDVAKMVQAPIFHVNADDPEAAFLVTQLALDYRNKFKKDVVIDLVCYRRHGHQEVDEPTATQPLMYQQIKKHKVPYQLYTEQLIQEGLIKQADLDQLKKTVYEQYDQGKSPVDVLYNVKDPFATNWKPYLGHDWQTPGDTRVPMKRLKALAEKLDTLNARLTLQPQVKKMMAARAQMTAGEIPVNWGYAETLAYATLLTEQYPVRISGQDSERGTFAHRHAVLHDYKTGEILTPLNHLSDDQESFIIINSVLSEEAVLGFEYGFASSYPESLTIWEAQYGDFANGAQVYFDQFISSAEQKWNRLCGLVVLLPHGYEGSGPEHSSARLERFMQLCAQDNIQVCVPTTPAQIFHLLRRQMIRPYRKPLIVMSPKNLLRHKLAVSSLEELADGEFQAILSEVDKINEKKLSRVVLCSGKVYYDLLEKRRADKIDDMAIIRIEQLYPFPCDALTAILKAYQHVKDIVWCQEEPKNQGAWYASQHHIIDCLQGQQKLRYVGRPPSASPAVGYPSVHKKHQAALVEEALQKG